MIKFIVGYMCITDRNAYGPFKTRELAWKASKDITDGTVTIKELCAANEEMHNIVTPKGWPRRSVTYC